MSHRRILAEAGWVSKPPLGPNGERLCRRCREPVPKGRSTFCGDDCVHEWKLRSQPGYARRMVAERDRGVCAVCGVDTEKLRGLAERLDRVAYGGWRFGAWDGPRGYVMDRTTTCGSVWNELDWGKRDQQSQGWLEFPSARHRAEQLDLLVWFVLWWFGCWVGSWSNAASDPTSRCLQRWKRNEALWHADHIVPVVEGGGECGLDNLRTLCLRCHKDETRALAARRAKARRTQRELFEPG